MFFLSFMLNVLVVSIKHTQAIQNHCQIYPRIYTCTHVEYLLLDFFLK